MQPKPKPLVKTLDEVLEAKRQKDQENLDAEFKARAKQVQVLQGLTMQCRLVKCPHCGKKLIGANLNDLDDEQDTRF